MRTRLTTRGTTASVLALLVGLGPAQAQDFGSTGFSISDGDTVIAGATPPPFRTGLAPVDQELRRANVTVQFDTLDQTRRLNVATADLREAYQSGEPVTFRASSNYPAFLRRAEVRIFDRTRPGRKVVAVLPVQPNGTVDWAMPADGPDSYAYALRVYDAAGRFDETIPLALRRTARDTTGEAANSPFVAAGEGDDRTARRMIPVRGGTVIVSGTDLRPGQGVTVMGEPVPVDPSGKFVTSRILPVGDSIVTVETDGRRFVRDVYVPQSDWFATGILDITAGLTSGGINDDDDDFLNGRAAFYAKGRTATGWRITTSADTRDGPIEDMFNRLDDYDPLRVLDRLREDGTDLYPTYGDDSAWFDDTPTSGNIYARIENDTTRLTWGNFKTGIQGPGLLTHTRDLYGGELRYRTPGVTERGNPRASVSVFAAQSDTLPQRDILRGTGGSVYFLSRREIVGGSTTLTVQVSDAETGFVQSSRVLVEGRDYRVDHLQGVVILNDPLSSGASDGTIISGPSDELIVDLIAQYEFVPQDTDLGDASFGGRAEAWVTNNLRLGVTAMSEQTGSGRQRMGGADVRLQFGQTSFAEVEIAQSDGPGFGRATSTDGGLTIVESGGSPSNNAVAAQARVSLGFGDLGWETDGRLDLWYEMREAGFETLSQNTPSDQELFGLALSVGVTERLRFKLDAEHFEKDTGDVRTDAEVSLSYAIDDMWTIEGAVAHVDRNTPTTVGQTGTRTDAAIRLSYAPNEDLRLYGFVQGTLDRDGDMPKNNRIGLGFDAQVSDRLQAAAELSDGDGGLAGKARVSWRPNDQSEVYLGYTLDPTRSGAGSPLEDRGRVVAGTSFRHSDRLTTFNEMVFDQPGDQRSLTNAYGVTYTPDSVWTLSGGIETGRIRDANSGDFDRFGLSLGATWRPNEDQSGRVRLEYRTEDGAGTSRDRDTWAITAGYSTKVAPDWRFLADVDALFSESADGPLSDGEYLRASLGYAYRPIDNERLNMLFRLTYLHDLPSEDQRSSDGTTDGPQQRSTVLSAAANYDLSQKLTLSGKLGFRKSQVAARGSNSFTADTATLGALRLDWHVVDKWDIMGEGRVLYTRETETTETGAVLGVYRHLNDHVSLGVGYEWGSVSDDATAIDYDAQGVFLNLVGRF